MKVKNSSTNVFGHLGEDFSSGLVVFLVALPLCLGIALGSGVPPISGVIAGIIGGIVVGIASGSHLGVSGPAAGLIAIVIAGIEGHGFPLFLTAVVISGVLQIAMGYARAGLIAYYFPNSVIKGMLAAIGIILIMKQIPHAIGYDKDPEGDQSFFQQDGYTTLSELGHSLGAFSIGALVICLASMAVLLLWQTKWIKQSKLKLVPGALMAVAIGTALNEMFQAFVPSLGLFGEHLVQLPALSELQNEMTFPDPAGFLNPDILLIGVVLALVASLETLLCAEATDRLDPEHRHTPPNRELKAQGIGNIVSGLLGGLPITQVVVRSTANIDAGGRTKMATVVHGVLLLATVLFIPMVLNMIPKAALAALLLLIGYKLARVELFVQMYKRGLDQLAPFVITIGAIVFTNLLVGIGIGLAAGIFFTLRESFLNAYRYNVVRDEQDVEMITITLAEEVSFLNKASIQKILDGLEDGSKVVIDATKSKAIDLDVLDLLKDFEATAKVREIDYKVIGLGAFDGLGQGSSH